MLLYTIKWRYRSWCLGRPHWSIKASLERIYIKLWYFRFSIHRTKKCDIPWTRFDQWVEIIDTNQFKLVYFNNNFNNFYRFYILRLYDLFFILLKAINMTTSLSKSKIYVAQCRYRFWYKLLSCISGCSDSHILIKITPFQTSILFNRPTLVNNLGV